MENKVNKDFNVNEFRIENWLPAPIKEVLNKHLKYLETSSKIDLDDLNKLVTHKKLNKQKIEKIRIARNKIRTSGLIYFKNLFKEKTIMQDTWERITKKNTEQAKALVNYLLKDYLSYSKKAPHEARKDLVIILENKKEIINRIFNKLNDPELKYFLGIELNRQEIKQLVDNNSMFIKEFSCGYGELAFAIFNEMPISDTNTEFMMPYNIHNDFSVAYQIYLKELKKINNSINSKLFDRHIYINAPISRKSDTENPEAILFIKQMYIVIKKMFHSATRKDIANMATAIFDTEYSETDVSTLTRRACKYLKTDRSKA